MKKVCVKCGKEKDLSGFYFRKDSNDFRSECKKCCNIRNKEYSKNNEKEIKEYHSKYNEERQKLNKEYRARREKLLKQKSINYKISSVLRSRLYTVIKGRPKVGSAVSDLGCSVYELVVYLENQFTEGMTWDNHGKWHIDHIVPLSSFDLTDRPQLLKACHYTNLQPLWAEDNLKKGSKIF